MHISRNFKQKAFTLVELLVVISIIALLLSILMPSLERARSLAKEVVCMSNLETIGTAFVMYQNDYTSFPVESNVDWFGPVNLWQGQIAKYLGGKRSSDYIYAPGNWTGDNPKFPDRQNKIFQCKRGRKNSYWFGNTCGYGINRYLWLDQKPHSFFKVNSLKKPASTFVVMDSDYYLVYDGVTAYGTSHSGKKNVLYCDIHVKKGYFEKDVYWDGKPLWGDAYWAWLYSRE